MTTHFDTVVSPLPAHCAYLRTVAGLTLAQMADIVHLADRQSWWRFEAGTRQCGLATWELALLKTGQHPYIRLIPRKLEMHMEPRR